MKKALVSLDNVSKIFLGSKHPAVSGVSANLIEAKCYALLGASGCGKTTVLRLIAGLETPSTGSISIAGQIVANDSIFLRAQKRGVGMVFQNYALFPHMTVEDNIKFGLDEKNPKRIEEMLELTDLKEFRTRYPHELSGGQQQRVALARALAPEPKVLLMDEPFSNLDHHLKEEVRTSLKNILTHSGICSVLVTHSPEDAKMMADQFIIMNEGEIIANGNYSELEASQNKFVKRYF